jgi:tRNA dimethylallyltransferase
LYRYLHIGAAKTPLSERRGIPHHLIDVLNPDEHFTAGDYSRATRPVLHDIAARGRVPIVVGGTGFYIRALLQGLFEGPSRDPQLRQRLTLRKPGSLHRLLCRFDPASARRIHPNDVQKLTRALEVCLLAKRPLTVLFQENPTLPLSGFRVFKVGLNPSREELAARIDERCIKMFSTGLVEEVQHVLSLGFATNAKALEAIGYREALLYLKGETSFPEAVTLTQAATRQYAKRQRTWFRRDPEIHWRECFGNENNVAADLVHHLKVDIRFI